MATKTATKPDTSINFTNDAEVVAALKAFAEAKATIKAAEEAKEAAEYTIRAALGDKTEGIVRGVVAVKVSSTRERKSNDAKILAEAFPEAYEASLKISTYNFITVNF